MRAHKITTTLDKIAILDNSHRVIILLFEREDITAKKINTVPLKDFGGIFVDLNVRKIIILFL